MKQCSKCNRFITDDSEFCPYCGEKFQIVIPNRNQHEKIRFVPWIITGCLLVLLVSGCIFHFSEAKKSRNVIDTLIKIQYEMNDIISEQDAVIEKNKNEIEALTKSKDNFKESAKYFDDLCKIADKGPFGFVSDSFKLDNSVLVLYKSLGSENVNLTANWENGNTVTYEFSTEGIASIEYERKEGSSNAKLVVKPLTTGVTTVTFRNSSNHQLLKMLIIVK